MNQRVALGIEIEPHFAAEAKKRQLATLKKGDVSVVANIPQREQARSRDQAALAVGISGKTLNAAKAGAGLAAVNGGKTLRKGGVGERCMQTMRRRRPPSEEDTGFLAD